jgi:hypothetical protein
VNDPDHPFFNKTGYPALAYNPAADELPPTTDGFIFQK